MDAMRHRVKLLNTWIDHVDLEEAGKRIHAFVSDGTPHQIATVNLDFLRISHRNSAFRALLNTSNLVVADGMPLVWASGLAGDPLPARVPGVDLVLECARVAAENNHSMFLLGAGPGIAEKTANLLRQQYPALRIAGTYAPPSVSEEDDARTLEVVRATAPDILLVAFGAPRQEQWIRKHMDSLRIPVSIGVGGSFDMLSGRVSRAPRWMQGAGLEWFYRFIEEPGRMWKRYFVHDLPIYFQLMARSGMTVPSSQSDA
ncbi:MAG: hypothetical protein NVS2B16_23700 [Chloroflexota bacterium]